MRILLLALLVSCGDNLGTSLNSRLYKQSTCKIEGNFVVCPDGSKFQIPSGKDGEDGQDGTDGEDGVLLIEASVDSGQCTQVYPNVYVENISSGKIFDVYYNDSCKDNLGEYCDNVQTSYGSSGTFGNNKVGNGTNCWAGPNRKLFITGLKNSDDSISVRVMDFN